MLIKILCYNNEGTKQILNYYCVHCYCAVFKPYEHPGRFSEKWYDFLQKSVTLNISVKLGITSL